MSQPAGQGAANDCILVLTEMYRIATLSSAQPKCHKAAEQITRVAAAHHAVELVHCGTESVVAGRCIGWQPNLSLKSC